MIISAALNIKKGDFYRQSHLLLLLFTSAMHLWNFVVTTVTPSYLFLAFRDDGD